MTVEVSAPGRRVVATVASAALLSASTPARVEAGQPPQLTASSAEFRVAVSQTVARLDAAPPAGRVASAGGQGPAGIQGVQGPQGVQGIQGVPGADGDKHYSHSQGSPSAAWSVTHGLGKYPSVTVIDSAGTTVVGSVTHLSANALAIQFSAPFSGTAHCN